MTTRGLIDELVIEPPFRQEAIARQIRTNPNAAAVCAHLLELLPQLTVEAGLTAESLAYGVLQGGDEHRRWLASRSPVPQQPPGRLGLHRQDDVLTVTLDRPGQGNAIDVAMRDALFEAFTLATLDQTITRVELAGAGRCFSLGGDLAEFGTTRDPATAHAIRMQTLPARALLGCRDRLTVHVHGPCIGAGLEIAAFARRITASPKAWFQLPELAMGLIPGAGGCVSLSHRIGPQRTLLMVLSGQRLSASQALKLGLIDAIYDEGSEASTS